MKILQLIRRKRAENSKMTHIQTIIGTISFTLIIFHFIADASYIKFKVAVLNIELNCTKNSL